MATRNPVSTASVFGHPLHPVLIPFPIAFSFQPSFATSCKKLSAPGIASITCGRPG
jgi:hypothetical protein